MRFLPTIPRVSSLNCSAWVFVSLTVFCLVLPWSLAAMQVTLVAVVLLGIVCHLKAKSFSFRLPAFVGIVGIYGLLRLLSALFSPDISHSLKAVLQNEWVVFTLPFLIFLPLSETQIETALRGLVISGVVAAVYGCVQFFLGMDPVRGKELTRLGHFYRATGGYNFYLTFAGNQLMILGMALSFFLHRRGWDKGRVGLLGAVVLLFASLIATFGRSTWLALPVMIALGTLLINRRWFGYAVAAMAVGFVVVAAVFPDVQQRFVSIFDPSQNEGRLNLWRTAWRMISAHPIWGIGPGMFDAVFETYKVPGFYDAFGHAHNDYLNMAVNSGIPAMLAWITLWGYWLYRLIRAYRVGGLSRSRRQMVLGSLLSITGILFAALFQCYYTDLENNIMWWFLAAMGFKATLPEGEAILARGRN